LPFSGYLYAETVSGSSLSGTGVELRLFLEFKFSYRDGRKEASCSRSASVGGRNAKIRYRT
jgi:hypothetical protein